MWWEKGCEGGFWGWVVWVCWCALGRVGLKMCSEGGVVFYLVGRVVLVRGLRPVPPCFCSVGGGAPVGGVGLVLRVPVCVWYRNGGCRPAPQLRLVKDCPPVERWGGVGFIRVSSISRTGRAGNK